MKKNSNNLKEVIKHKTEKYFFFSLYLDRPTIIDSLINSVSGYNEHVRSYEQWSEPIVIPVHYKFINNTKENFYFKDYYHVIAPRFENRSTFPHFDEGDCVIFLVDQKFQIHKWAYNSSKKEILTNPKEIFL